MSCVFLWRFLYDGYDTSFITNFFHRQPHKTTFYLISFNKKALVITIFFLSILNFFPFTFFSFVFLFFFFSLTAFWVSWCFHGIIWQLLNFFLFSLLKFLWIFNDLFEKWIWPLLLSMLERFGFSDYNLNLNLLGSTLLLLDKKASIITFLLLLVFCPLKSIPLSEI